MGFELKVGVEMNIETKRMADRLGILVLSGNLNNDQLDTFKNAISELLSEGFENVIIDCRDLGIISSSGLADSSLGSLIRLKFRLKNLPDSSFVDGRPCFGSDQTFQTVAN